MKITEQLIRKSCSATIYKRGMEYFREGRVHLRKREDNLITAVVDGDELYNVQIKLDDEGIADCFCTCPYYETMNSMCKHIVATLKQRQTEIDEGGSFVDENDKLAQLLCSEFAAKNLSGERLGIKFILYVNKSRGALEYDMAAEMGGSGAAMQGIENFLDSYLRGKPFKIDKATSYIPGVTLFSPQQTEILDILAESYENRSAQSVFYTKAPYQTSFGAQTARRIFPLLKDMDFLLIFDGMNLGRTLIKEENPDIIVDVDAADGEISMSVGDRGFALVNDGEWFLYEGVIYRTSPEWRGYYMPIYHALESENRTQLSFKGENTMLFATHVLPNIKGRHGIITRGIEDMVVNETPVFEVYFDMFKNGITAVIKANYGDVSIRLPGGSGEDISQKIVVRSFAEENEILSFFSGFAYSDGIYSLHSDSAIYDFIMNDLEKLGERAELYYSERFGALRVPEKVNISASVRYNSDIDFLEADFDTDLSFEQVCGILNAVKTKRSFYRLSNGRFLDLEDKDSQTVFGLLNSLDFTAADVKGRGKRLSLRNALYLDAVSGIDKDKSFKEYIKRIKNVPVKIPDRLETVLRPYQRSGVKWFTQLSKFGFGGILADDMGLGKRCRL